MFLPKPFSLKELAQAVKGALGNDSGTDSANRKGTY
jgi:DNA-binding response OmpR family regulator